MIINKKEHPVFISGALLKSEDLNSQFQYLDEHQRQAVAGLDGCGVAYGLEVTWANNQITIGKGLAVTSKGHLIVLDESISFKHYKGFVILQDKLGKNTFGKDTLGDFKELTKESTTPLTTEVVSNKCIMLYLESEEKYTNICGTRQGAKNKEEIFTVKYLMADYKPSLDTSSCLTPLCLPCFGRNKSDFTDIYNNYHSLIFDKQGGTISASLSIIETAYSGLLKCYASLFCADGFTEFTPLFNALRGSLERTFSARPNVFNHNIQFAYDYLHHLVAAYNEFIATDWITKGMKNPDATAYPYHVRLGSGSDCGDCRHKWQPSPANSDAYEEAQFYARRMIEMVREINLTFGALPTDIKITPSRPAGHPLSMRAIPFYFSESIREFWSYPLSKTLMQSKIPKYPLNDPNHTIETAALRCDTEGYDFYRVEGHIGKELGAVLEELEGKKRQYNLPFDIIALHVNQGIDWDNAETLVSNPNIVLPFGLDDLEREFVQHKLLLLNNICNLKNIYKPPKVDPPAKPFDFKPIVEAISETNFKSFNFGEFKDDNNKALDDLNKIYPDCAYYQLDYFKVLERIYRSRLKQTYLVDFVDCHLGAKYGASVPKGGTLILVYKTEVVQPEEEPVGKAILAVQPRKNIVIADLMLPCCYIDWNDVPTAVFSIEKQDSFSNGGVAGDDVDEQERTIVITVRNLSVNATAYTWTFEIDNGKTIKDITNDNAIVIDKGFNGKLIFSSQKLDALLKEGSNIAIIVKLSARKDNKDSRYEEDVDIMGRRMLLAKAIKGKEIPVPSKEKQGINPIVEEKGRAITPLSITGGIAQNTKALNQRRDLYKNMIEDGEMQDVVLKENNAFKLAKMYILTQKSKNNLTPDFEEAIQALIKTYNRSKNEEQQRNLMQVLRTTTYCYLDRIVAMDEPEAKYQKSLEQIQVFMVKHGINTVDFIVDWNCSAIETKENKHITTRLLHFFD